MKMDTLETLTDDQLRAIITRSNEILVTRDGQRKEEARQMAAKLEAETQDRIRVIFEAAGLSYEPQKGKLKRKKVAVVGAFKPKSGHMYQHPDNPSLQCPGTGNKPKWWHELAKAGRQPVDLGPAKAAA